MKLTEQLSTPVSNTKPIQKEINEFVNKNFTLELTGKELLYLAKICRHIGGSGEFHSFFTNGSVKYPNDSLSKNILKIEGNVVNMLDHLVNTRQIVIDKDFDTLYVHGKI